MLVVIEQARIGDQIPGSYFRYLTEHLVELFTSRRWPIYLVRLA